MGQPRKWLDEIVEVIEELGGKATLSDIRRKVKERNIMHYKESSIPRTLERYCRESKRFETGQDVFYIIEGKRRDKVWGLKKYINKNKDKVTHSTFTELAPEIVKGKYFNRDVRNVISNTINTYENFSLISEDKLEYNSQKSKKRKGQSEFRNTVLKTYDFKCCVTSETCIEVLQAAHIQPYINNDSNHVQNSLCLRIDIHKLFDEGLITLNDEFEIVVSSLLEKSHYKSLEGRKINLPKDKNDYPSLCAIKKHREVFRHNPY